LLLWRCFLRGRDWEEQRRIVGYLFRKYVGIRCEQCSKAVARLYTINRTFRDWLEPSTVIRIQSLENHVRQGVANNS
jgi:hypothetical protein